MPASSLPFAKAIASVAQYFRAFASFLRACQERKAIRQDQLSQVEIDSDAELARQHAINHAIEYLQDMYGQDFGLKRLIQEISQDKKR